jgi:hypothetical protein
MNDDEPTIDAKVVRALWLGQLGGRRRRVARPPTRRARPLELVELFPRERGGRPLIFMSYAVGDYVVPTDLPRPFLCRVTQARSVGNMPIQILEMAPLEGPWPPDTRLIRGGDFVRPAAASELADLRRRRAARARAATRPPRRRRRSADRTDPPHHG